MAAVHGRRLGVAALAFPLALSTCSGPTEPRLVATSVAIVPTALTLGAIGASRQLSVIVKDQNGGVIKGASVAWSSSDATVVTVDTAMGLVSAVGDGTAQVRATSGSASGSITVSVQQIAARLVKVSGDSQSGVVGQTLPHAIVVQVGDSNGYGVGGTRVGFAVTSGAGVLGATSTVTDASGKAQTTWEMGHGAGNQTVEASAGGGVPVSAVTFRASALAGPPASAAKQAGDSQSVAPGQAVPTPPAVVVKDAYGNPVPGVLVSFAVTAGGGSVTGAAPVTNAEGVAAVGSWTLGAAGDNELAATVTGPGVAGNPEVFSALASTVQVTSIQPDTLVEGQAATVTGEGFSVSIPGDSVLVDGVAAAVVSAAPTSLTITVPSYDCRPARPVTVRVVAGGQDNRKTGVPLQPAGFLALAAGQQAIVQDPAAFCLQFRPSNGPEEYVVGLTAPAESPGGVLPFAITSMAGTPTSSALFASPRANTAAPSLGSPLRRRGPFAMQAGGLTAEGRRLLEARLRQQRAELRLQERALANFPMLMAQAWRPRPIAPMAAGRITAAPPAVGDTVVVNFPAAGSADPCNTYTRIKTIVRAVGTAGIWLYDVQNPPADSLTQAEIESASDLFDAKIFDSDTTHFGAPTDIDGNGHVMIVLTWQVNRIPAGYQGFVEYQDLVPGPSCPQSNGGEIFYGEVPDSANVAGTGPRLRADVVHGLPDLIAHEVTHLIQVGQRVLLGGGVFPPSWEAEGQAVFAEELAGDAVLGNTSYQNYDQHVALSVPAYYWYSYGILDLAEYFGTFGSQPDSAPDLCSVYANQAANLPCDVSAFYGAAWMFQRYIADQFGPTYPGGLVQLTRDWVMKYPALRGSANIAALTGVDYDTLFARYATALAIDDRDNGTGSAWVPPALSITSWNTDSLGTWLETCCSYRWLTPPVMGFSSATALRSVRGGSTAYLSLSSAGAHPADAVKLTDTGGAVLNTALRPMLWVVRVR